MDKLEQEIYEILSAHKMGKYAATSAALEDVMNFVKLHFKMNEEIILNDTNSTKNIDSFLVAGTMAKNLADRNLKEWNKTGYEVSKFQHLQYIEQLRANILRAQAITNQKA